MSSNASTAGARTIVVIHRMWMTPLSWEDWAARYREHAGSSERPER